MMRHLQQTAREDSQPLPIYPGRPDFSRARRGGVTISTTTIDANTQSFGYDALNRLTSATGPYPAISKGIYNDMYNPPVKETVPDYIFRSQYTNIGGGLYVPVDPFQ